MKSINNLLFIGLALLVLHSCKEKAVVFVPEFPIKPGYVVFNVGDNTFKNYKNQSIMLFGCNTALTNTSPDWHAPRDFQWNTSDQVLSGIPFGHKNITVKNKKIDYYVNKYYVASPPVSAKKHSIWGEKFDIGLVIPDQFTLDGESPVQEVYLDYTPLVPQLTYEIPFELDASVVKSGIKHIPFKVESINFPWYDGPLVKNGKGASGIGFFQPGKGNDVFNSNSFFLPYNKNGTKDDILKTEVTLLNDIMLLYKFHFMVPDPKDGMKRKRANKINLTEYYKSIEEYFDKKKDSITNKKAMVKLVAKRRAPGDVPCGCKKPKEKNGPYGK